MKTAGAYYCSCQVAGTLTGQALTTIFLVGNFKGLSLNSFSIGNVWGKFKVLYLLSAWVKHFFLKQFQHFEGFTSWQYKFFWDALFNDKRLAR